MRKYEITEEQIKDLANGKAKSKLKQLFPEVFEKKTGEWYKHEAGGFTFFTTENTGYGINSAGLWIDKPLSDLNSPLWQRANIEEVEEALRNEAIKRYGYNWKDAKIKEDVKGDDFAINTGSYGVIINVFSNSIWNRNGQIFEDGKWAEPMLIELTMQEIADKFNIPVETLKIKK